MRLNCRSLSGDSPERRQAPATAPLGQPLSTAAELRCHCRTVVLMQRACTTILEHCSGGMPAAVQLQLLSILQVQHPPPPLPPPPACTQQPVEPASWSSWIDRLGVTRQHSLPLIPPGNDASHGGVVRHTGQNAQDRCSPLFILMTLLVKPRNARLLQTTPISEVLALPASPPACVPGVYPIDPCRPSSTTHQCLEIAGVLQDTVHRASTFNHSSHRRLIATKLLSRDPGAQPGRASLGEAASADRAAQPLQNGSASASEIAASGQQHSGAPRWEVLPTASVG